MDHNQIERAIEILRELVAEDPEREAALVASRGEFFGAEPGAGLDEASRALADRRHFEWFAFEGPQVSAGGPAGQELRERWEARADGDLRAWVAALLRSRAGIFEVLQADPRDGLLVQDLLSRASLVVDEPEAAAELAVGDLLVGRLASLDDEQFLLSPAVACFRNPDLRAALVHDLEGLAASRRGTLRIAQSELERMFFSVRGSGEAEPVREQADELAAEFTELLVEGGVERERAEAWVESLRGTAEAAARAGRDGAEVRSGLLDGLAFDTEVDLDRARHLIGPAWEAFGRQARPADESGAPGAALETDGGAAEDGAGSAVERALANYDRGRAAGQGLDQLFDALEAELGLDPGDEHDDEVAPDFPGVVGAMIGEYLWERAHQGRTIDDEARAVLERLGEFSAELGRFEELSAEHLRRFAAWWLLDRGLLAGVSSASAALGVLEDFARWVEEEHEFELWSDFADVHARLKEALPRAVEANVLLGAANLDVGSPGRLDVLEDVATARVGVRDGAGEWRPLSGPAAVLALLREGDQVACRFEGDVALPLRCYPDAARELG